MRTILILLLVVYFPSLLWAQGELDEQETIFYNDERTWGLYLGTSGYGFNFRHGRRINAFKKRLWAIDMAGLRHPKKHSTQNQINPTAFTVYGKTNSIVAFRYSYGLQQEIFRKIDKGGIAIKWYYLGGATLVWQKPIYYNVEHITGISSTFKVERFTADNRQSIQGRASYFLGFSESTFVPGAYLNTGLSFDYSTQSNRVYALEVGACLDVFPKKLDILYGDNNPMFFLQVYGTLRFGKIVDRMKVRLKKTRRKMEKTRKKNEKAKAKEARKLQKEQEEREEKLKKVQEKLQKKVEEQEEEREDEKQKAEKETEKEAG